MKAPPQSPAGVTGEMEAMFDRLWPICRSLAGPGFRQSLDILREWVPFTDLLFASGETVFDWTVPREWHPREAFLVAPDGRRCADFSGNNLHLLGYSTPFRGRLGRDELDAHLHSLPEMPGAIPYLTSYYRERWGFCLAENERRALPEGEYEVVVDTELVDGHLTVGECVLPGETDEELFFSSYLCHPSMANNELSGPLALVALYRRLKEGPRRRHTCRFVVAPETIGALCYLSRRGEHLVRNMAAGWVLTCAGDAGVPTYKRSRRGNSLADRAAAAVLRDFGEHREVPFVPMGSDERQYCSPGFDLPVGSLMRTMYGEYPEYHTSLDNKDFISFPALEETVDLYVRMVDAIENNHTWVRTQPHGEPFLSRHGLYPTVGSQKETDRQVEVIAWLLNLSDGKHDLLAIAERSGCALDELIPAAAQLISKGLLAQHGD